jgi:hypothetical protein
MEKRAYSEQSKKSRQTYRGQREGDGHFLIMASHDIVARHNMVTQQGRPL